MKIFYGAGPNFDTGQQLARFVAANKHEIKIAAHLKSSEIFSHIHWTLDALYNSIDIKNSQDIFQLLGHAGAPKIVMKQTEILLREIDDYSPDLIISNAEPVSAHLGKALNIKTWYCSPLHLLDGVEWERGDLRYLSLLSATKKFLSTLPTPDKILVYSPFGDLTNSPALKSGYEWIQPYWIPAQVNKPNESMAVIPTKQRFSRLTKVLNCVSFDLTLFTQFSDSFTHLKTKLLEDMDSYKKAISNCRWFFTPGDTSYLADAIYNAIPRICIAPSLNEPENLLNAILCKQYGFGDDVAQVELMDKYAIAELEKSQAKQTGSSYTTQISAPKLNEKVDEYALLF